MRIATTINLSVLFTEKRKRILYIITMVGLYGLYESIEFDHHDQMLQDDNFWTTCGWIVAIPGAIYWLWGEQTKNHWGKFLGPVLFLFAGPVLAMGSELRNLHIFTTNERWKMFACMILGIMFFILYVRSVFENLCEEN